MGQRLNIEVVEDGEVLANAYYHWSAYTKSAAGLAGIAVDAFHNAKAIGGVALAVEMLQATGAGINEDERKRIEEECGTFTGIQFNECTNRNEGLLAVTRGGIEETELYEEGRVSIDIGTEIVTFGVFFWFDHDGYIECYSAEEYNELPVIESLDIEELKFKDFHTLIELLNKFPNGVRLQDGSVYLWIS